MRNSASLAYLIQEYASYFRERFEPDVVSSRNCVSHPGFDGLLDTLSALHYMAWSCLASNGVILDSDGPPGKLTCSSLLQLLEAHLYYLVFDYMFAWYKRKQASLEVALVIQRQNLRSTLSLTRLQVPRPFRLAEDPTMVARQAELESEGETELLNLPYRSVTQALNDLGRSGADNPQLCSPTAILAHVVALVDRIGVEITQFNKTSGEKFESLTSDDLILILTYAIGQTHAQGLNGMVRFLMDFLQHAAEKKPSENKVDLRGLGVRAAATERGPRHAFHVTPGYKDAKHIYAAHCLGQSGYALASLSSALDYFVREAERNL